MATKKSSSKKPTQVVEKGNPSSSKPKKTIGNEIDQIFSGKKRKIPQVEKTSGKEPKLMKKNKRESKGDREGRFTDPPPAAAAQSGKKKTVNGLTIYTEEELGINKADAGVKHCASLFIAGDTPSSNRFIDAIASHCLPVIISDDIELPYEDVLDYSRFCIFVHTSDAINEKFLINLVRSIGKDEWTRMWQKLKEFERFYEFQYPLKEDDVVEMIWQAVARKVFAIKMKVHKSRHSLILLPVKTGG